MSNKGSNGSTASFNGTPLTGLTSIQCQIGGADVDISALADARKNSLGGMEEISVTLGFNTTNHGLAYDDVGDVAIAFNDGGAESINDMRIASVDKNAQKDSPLASTVTLKPTEVPAP